MTFRVIKATLFYGEFRSWFMGLSVIVGVLSDIDDPEDQARFADLFKATAKAMIAANLPAHVEPTEIECWSAEGYGYSGLHALREVAGLIWQGKPIPRAPLITGKGETPFAEALFNQALASCGPLKQPGFIARLFGKPAPVASLPPFSHLSMHSDAEGFYVPVNFETPIIPKVMDQATASIWPLGSTQRLQSEIDHLAAVLEIPDGLTSQDETLWEAIESPVTDQALWQAQPVAAYSAIILREACRASLATGAAITFT
ncbi:MAG: hypothetical protein WCC57_08065 [Paracoccaceae bacterium]